jgi:hypothetical protein
MRSAPAKPRRHRRLDEMHSHFDKADAGHATSYNAVAWVDRNVELGRGDKIAFIDVAPTAGARSQESRESNGWAWKYPRWIEIVDEFSVAVCETGQPSHTLLQSGKQHKIAELRTFQVG